MNMRGVFRKIARFVGAPGMLAAAAVKANWDARWRRGRTARSSEVWSKDDGQIDFAKSVSMCTDLGLQERVADLKARQEYTQNAMPVMPPPAAFMQQMQQMQQQVQQAQQQVQQQQQAAQQAQQQAQAQGQAQQQPQQQMQPTGNLSWQPKPHSGMQCRARIAVACTQGVATSSTTCSHCTFFCSASNAAWMSCGAAAVWSLQAYLEQRRYPLPTGFGAGMVALPAAAFQQMLAAHAARLGQQPAAAPASSQQQQSAVPAAFKAPGAVDVLSSAACLYMPSAELDVSADSVKRPPAA